VAVFVSMVMIVVMLMAVVVVVAVVMVVVMVVVVAVVMIVVMLMAVVVAVVMIVVMLMAVAVAVVMVVVVAVVMVVVVAVVMAVVMVMTHIHTLFLFPVHLYRNMGACNAAFDRWDGADFHAGKSQTIETPEHPLRIRMKLQEGCCEHIARRPHCTVKINGFHKNLFLLNSVGLFSFRSAFSLDSCPRYG